MISRLLTPLLVANLLGLVAGAMWLGLGGQWSTMGLGLFTVLFAPALVIPILLVPAGVLSHFIGLYQAQGRKRAERLALLGSLGYIVLFLALWCAGIFSFVTADVSGAALPPAVLWGACCAMAPLFLWSYRDRSNVFVMFMVEVAQACVLAAAALRLAGYPSLPFAFAAAGFFVVLALAAALRMMWEERMRGR